MEKIDRTSTKFLRIIHKILRGSLTDIRSAAYLCGSWASGTATRASDLDIGLLPKTPLPDGFLSELKERFEESGVPFRVDLFDLSLCDSRCRSRVLKTGIKWIG